MGGAGALGVRWHVVWRGRPIGAAAALTAAIRIGNDVFRALRLVDSAESRVVSMIVLFLLTRRHYIRRLTAGAIKA